MSCRVLKPCYGPNPWPPAASAKKNYAARWPPAAIPGMGAIYVNANRNKRSITLDLKSDEGKKAFLELIPRYDVLLESNRPGVMSRLGLGYETQREVNPGLVYCAITPFGRSGPRRDELATDRHRSASSSRSDGCERRGGRGVDDR